MSVISLPFEVDEEEVRLTSERWREPLALAHETVQELHVEQSLRRHDTVCLFQNRGDLLSNVLCHLWQHGDVIHPVDCVSNK